MRIARAAGALLAFAVIAFAFAARRGRDGTAELQPHPQTGPPSPPPFAPKPPLRTAAEAEEGVRRVFGGTVRVADAFRYLLGDFNGDGTEDLAVPVRPMEGRREELNNGLANWSVQDALTDPADRGGRPEPSAVIVQPDEVLLAVVHGYGVHGWRDVRARQCYLVRHATGAPLEARPRAELLRCVWHMPEDACPKGDVILASVGRRPGFVYWTGSRYAWHRLPSRSAAIAP